MSENIRKRGNTWHYDFKVDGVRYRGSCQTDDKALAEKIASTIKADILRHRSSFSFGLLVLNFFLPTPQSRLRIRDRRRKFYNCKCLFFPLSHANRALRLAGLHF
jgi:hypothetical protein